MAAPDTSDPRVARSRARLADALMTLLRTHDAQDVSVSALCAEAGVSRPTFYQHFASVDEVAVAVMERRFSALGAGLAADPDAAHRQVVALLGELDAERDRWRRTIGGGSGLPAARDAVETWFAERLAEHSPDAGPVAVRYAAAGFVGVVRAWLLEEDGPRREGPAELAERLAELSSRVLVGP